MRPTPIVAFNCRNIINLPLPNVDIYYNGEIFKEVIFYDGRILPQYYISNYGRVYSVYSQKLKIHKLIRIDILGCIFLMKRINQFIQEFIN